jgi:hypothetical protein
MKDMLRISSLMLIVFIFTITPVIVQAGWITLTSDNFESGWGNYTSGGANAVIYTYSSGTNFAHQGIKAADIESISTGNGNASSFYHTNGIDVATPGYTQIKVDFWFRAVGMETGEAFWVQYSSDGGTNWSTVASYVSGTNFNNDTFYNKTVTILESSYPFTNNAKIRFRCNASSVNDDVYIDEIVVSAYPAQVTVPNVVGLEQAAAEAAITDANLAVGTVTTSYSNTVPLGHIISQNPAGGIIVQPGSPVNITVSLGTLTIDMEDLEKFVEHWLESGCGTCGGADLSGDNDVDFEDFALFAANWLVEPELSATLVINEFMASNNSTIADPQGDYDDWIEIYNYGSKTVDMGGMYIADDSTLWQIPAGVSLNTGSYLLIWADNDAGDSPGLHANFKLDADSDQIRLFKSDGTTLIDGITFGSQTTDVSYGRYPDGENYWYDMNEPTPGAANKIGMAGEVEFSKLSGTFTSNFSLTLATASPTATIRYTTNGTIPTASSTLYSGPIAINNAQTRIIRARAYQSGFAPGPVTSQTYLPLASDVQGFSSNLPIVIVDTAGFDIDEENDSRIDYAPRPVSSAFIDINDMGRASVKDLSDFAGRGGLKVRGDSSAADWVAANWAKQYAFEPWDENNNNKSLSILGFPEESNWILHIPYDDKSLMRNVLAYKWFNEMGNYASRTKYVELFLNKNGGNVSMSDYWGVYILMERIKVDKNRVDIAKLQPTDNAEPEVSGGYIIKHDKFYDPETGFTTTQNKTGTFLFQDPKYYEVTTQQKAWIKGYLDELETALYGGSYTDPVNGYAKYMDANTFVDFHWMVEITKQVDAYVFSTYMYKDRNGKLKMGPAWDYNLGFGNAYGPPGPENYAEWQRSCQGWYYSNFGSNYMNAWFDRLRTDAEYNLRCADRWFELREDKFNDANIVADIDYYYNLLSAEAAGRHFNRWQLYVNPATGIEVGSGGVWASILNAWTWPNWYYGTPNNPHTYLMEVNWMKTWMAGNGTSPGLYSDRLYWIDNNIGYAFPPNFTIGGVAMNRGGHVSSGASLTMTGSTGTIYYTLNGSDPRGTGGSIVGTAYSSPITLNASVQVKARIKNGTAWSALNEAIFAVGPVAENLRVTEIMYHPEDTGDPNDPNTEFIELKNIGTSAINLNLVRFTNGVEFTFPNMSLDAGQYVLVVKDQAAFEDKYDTTGLNIAAGEYIGSLSNGGEEIHLKDAVGTKILEFTYQDGWYPITDGNDFTLNIINPANPDVNSWDEEESWQASNVKGGSPGAAYTSNIVANGAIVINEVLTHQDDLVYGDWIELYNTTASPINIGGWFLSDNAGNFRKYQITAGTTIPANGYKVFTEVADFGTAFGLSELGETVFLSSGSAGQLSGGYSIKEDFGAMTKDVTIGRYIKSAAAGYDVDFTAMASATKEAANSAPLVPAVVINEIMYNSATQYDKLAEYIELYNRSGSTVKLYDPNNPSNTWKFTNGIDFTFPAGVTLGPYKYLLVSRCHPTIFRTVYSVPPDVNVFGPFANGTELANDGEKVELSKPEEPELDGYVPYIRVEQVNYSDGSHPLGSDPWPTSADGKGSSLGRKVPGNYGNDVDNWQAVTPSPGTAN